MNTRTFRTINETLNWLVSDARRLADEKRIIVVETVHGVLMRAHVIDVDTNRATLTLRCEDDTVETFEATELLSVKVTDSFRMTPDRAYREMRALEEAHRIPKN